MGNVPVVIQGKVETPTGFLELRSQDEWLNWLAQQSSFRYEPQSEYPGFTARVEKSGYWYGYRKISGKLHKRYIGKAEELTTERLEQIAALLEQPSQPRPRPEKVTENLSSVTFQEDYVTQYVTREDFEQLRSEFESLRSELEQLRSESKNPIESTATATGIEVQNGSFFQEEDSSTVGNETEELRKAKAELELLNERLQNTVTELQKENERLQNTVTELQKVRQVQTLTSEVLPGLSELESVRDRVLGNWRVKKGAESKDRIKQALDKFIEQLLNKLPSELLPKLPSELPNKQLSKSRIIPVPEKDKPEPAPTWENRVETALEGVTWHGS